MRARHLVGLVRAGSKTINIKAGEVVTINTGVIATIGPFPTAVSLQFAPRWRRTATDVRYEICQPDAVSRLDAVVLCATVDTVRNS
jgi:hypothetical protein